VMFYWIRRARWVKLHGKGKEVPDVDAIRDSESLRIA
jgi:hypothetical protein